MPLIGTTTDLLVIGGGFWGTAAAIIAKEDGASVIVLDSGDPKGASRNAAGIVCSHWYRQKTIRSMTPDEWDTKEVVAGISFLDRFGLRKTGEVFSSYSDPEKRERADCYLLGTPADLLDQVRRVKTVVSRLVRREGFTSAETDVGTFNARFVLVAAGVKTDDLLTASGFPPTGVVPLRGRAIIAKTEITVSTPWTYMSRPYTHWTLREFGAGRVRLGDSVERINSRGFVELRKQLGEMSPGAKVERILDGLRPVCDKFFVKRVTPRIVAATGGHRVGLGMSGYVAKRCLRLLGITPS